MKKQKESDRKYTIWQAETYFIATLPGDPVSVGGCGGMVDIAVEVGEGSRGRWYLRPHNEQWVDGPPPTTFPTHAAAEELEILGYIADMSSTAGEFLHRICLGNSPLTASMDIAAQRSE